MRVADAESVIDDVRKIVQLSDIADELHGAEMHGETGSFKMVVDGQLYRLTITPVFACTFNSACPLHTSHTPLITRH